MPHCYFVDASSGAYQECDHTCEECSGSSRFCLSCRDGYFLLRKSGQCLRTCPSNYFPHTLDRDCQRCHPTCKTCKGSGEISCTSCYDRFKVFGGICSSTCLMGEYPIRVNNTCAPCDPSCNECKGPEPYSCTSCPILLRLTEDGRCLPRCGENTRTHSSRFPSECCQCHTLNDECIVAQSYNVFNNDPVAWVYPGLFVFTVIFVQVSLWLAIFLFLHFRQKITLKLTVKPNGYTKIADDPFTSANL
ncbi:proprotein convertase subtilisin/kexin type 5-like [Sinocyclocheilus rhinocerous]|uniref:proprotein convertase subtilisin/kexin type 5-like n=1 Tax=Sinocyclocheilus rhinocerous TaxID=307959 RepID=UPI0007BA6344|nr:PREDICTED: proprotein convertase subtilisin/kexin type 5-like [Sinocyclocheilus rhinocerous]